MANVYNLEDNGETLPSAVIETDLPGLHSPRRGKVRDVYDLGDRLLVIATDRISAFDSVLGTPIRDKGRMLTQLSLFWFDFLKGVFPNHFITEDLSSLKLPAKVTRVLAGRSMIVRKAQTLPVECIVRGYIVGSAWKEYEKSKTICGQATRPGYNLADRLDTPIFTPSTKAESGHDINIPFSEMEKLVGKEVAAQVRDASLALYSAAAAHALKNGIIIADTKFEFGHCDGKLIVIDEVLTPDSSRFWPADTYKPGANPPSFDKQYVRDWLEEKSGWNKEPPAPALPEEVAEKTREKYLEAFKRIAGKDLPSYK